MGALDASLADRIVRDPAILGGKPTVRGTRIRVEDVLDQLASSPSINEVFEAFPRLTLDDLRACAAYASDAVRRQRRLRPHAA
jgi:uncharacterized protein (DUF433 family)